MLSAPRERCPAPSLWRQRRRTVSNRCSRSSVLLDSRGQCSLRTPPRLDAGVVADLAVDALLVQIGPVEGVTTPLMPMLAIRKIPAANPGARRQPNAKATMAQWGPRQPRAHAEQHQQAGSIRLVRSV